MTTPYASITCATARYYSRHRRHDAHSVRSSRLGSVSLLSNHTSPDTAPWSAAYPASTRSVRTIFRYDGYTLGDENCLYLYGPEDIRY